MGIEQQLKITKRGVSYQANVSLHNQRRKYVPITDVGFGISQILPIVAVCLLSKPGDMVILEQPEIHLHPRAQAGLADLLLCTALCGKQVIVETHSDHLINRMRRRLAEYGKENNSNHQSDLVRIVFVSPPKKKGEGARVENALINKEGGISNWPPGFLVESATEARAILRAQTANKTGFGDK
jgi:predicted ATPase